tara:strand:- start:90 stop:503 length:414 start_codon:yes stop_codon:yes gene_type:complete
MATAQDNPVDVFERVTSSIGKLHSLGGISLVLSGIATTVLVLIIVLSAIGFDVIGPLGQNATLFLIATLLIGVAGACIGGLERFGEYRLAARRMDMMATLTEILVRSATSGDEPITPEGMKSIVRSAYLAVSDQSGN